jgi:4-amino-4-deoxy-L-arabinose transferase-like glycosyltransferase
LAAESHGPWAAASWPRWALLAWVVFAVAVLPWRALTPIDETRYASVAWEMWLRGDFVVPWLNGEPYGHKPPLLFWLIHAGWALFGVNAWWPLCVPALASGLSLWLLHRIATRLWPDRPAVAQLAPLLLFGAVQWTVFSVALYFDLLLATFVLLGVLALLDLAGGRWLRGGVLFTLAIGGGLLAKGPLVGINLLPVVLLLPWWARGVPRRSWARAWIAIAVSGAVGCAIAAGWLAAATAQAGRAFLDEVIYAQGLGRVVESFDHRLPFWWYAPMLWVVALPWAWWVDGWRALAGLRRHLDEPGVRLALAWTVPVFVMLSLISGKRAHYLMGMLPALALLGARAVEPVLARPGLRFGTAPAAALMIAAGVGLGLTPMWAERPGAPPWAALLPAWLGVLPAAIGVIWVVADRRIGHRLLALALGSAVLCGAGLIAFARVTAPAYDVTPAARRVAELVGQGVPVAVVGDYHGEFQFAGRLRAPLPVLERPAVDAWLARHPNGRLVAEVRRLPKDPPGDAWWYRSGWVVIVDAGRWATLTTVR